MQTGRIFIIILLFALFAGTAPSLEAAVPLPHRISLETDHAYGDESRFLKDALRKIDRLAKLSEVKSSPLRLTIRSASPEFQLFDRGRDRKLCFIPGSAPEWRASFALRRKIYAVLLTIRFDLPAAFFNADAPLWLTAALDEAIASGEESEQYFASNREYSLLRSLVRSTGKLPDFAALTALEKIPAGGVELRCYRQQSRLLAEILARRKLLKPLLSERETAPDRWVRCFSSRAEAQAVCCREADALLWTRLSPPPPRQLLDRMTELEETLVPELDHKGSPTGKMERRSYRQVAALLQKERPDAQSLRGDFVRNCRRFSESASPEVRSVSLRLAAAAEQFGKKADAPEHYAAALEQLKRRLLLECRREEFFERFCRENLSFARIWQPKFSAVTPENSALTEADKRRLDEQARRYLAEF